MDPLKKTLRGRGLVDGKATGEALVTKEPIHLLGGIDAEKGLINDRRHPLVGRCLAGKILVFPNSAGSSVGAYVIYRLANLGKAPRAIVTGKADIVTASGCALANIPLICLPSTSIQSIPDGAMVAVDGAKGNISWEEKDHSK